MKNVAKEIRKWLIFLIIGIFILVSAIPLYEYYKDNTYVLGELEFRYKSFDTMYLDYNGVKRFNDYEIGFENIKGKYTATLNDRVDYIEFIVQLKNLPESVQIEDVSLQIGSHTDRKYFEYHHEYIDFEYIVDNDTDTIKIIGNNFKAKYLFDDLDRISIKATLAGLENSNSNDTIVWIDLHKLIIN